MVQFYPNYLNSRENRQQDHVIDRHINQPFSTMKGPKQVPTILTSYHIKTNTFLLEI
jgi:hypothetical protein